MMRTIARVLSTACAIAAIVALAPCTALAGSYVINACSPGHAPGAWAQLNTAPAGFTTGNLCGGPEYGPLDAGAQGSLYANDILGSIADIPDGARAGWVFAAPAGATITSISYYRSLAADSGDRDVAAGLFRADGAVIEQCRIAIPLGSPLTCSMPNDQAPVIFSNLSTPSLFFGVLCDLVQRGVTACAPGGTIHEVQAYMYSARVTVSESVAPTVTDVRGALWEGGLASDTVPVAFSATDTGGIRELAIQDSSGQTILTTTPTCDYTIQPPCPNQRNATLNLDSTRVTDGMQTLTLKVTDAAGNIQSLTSPPIVIDNNGPPRPIGLTATTQPRSNTITLTWTNPPNPPAPISTAMTQLCTPSCAPPVSANTPATAQLTAPGPGTYSARVWLLDSAGRGGPHNAATTPVTITPPPPPPQPPPPSATHTQLTARLKGRRLHVSGPINATGRITVSWRSKIHGNSVAHGTRTITIHNQRLAITFAIPRHARTHTATIRIAIRSGRRIIAHARARRA